MSTIAFCGLGMMGSAMAGRLRAAGHEVHAWNRSQEKAQHWAADGGNACDSPASAARGAEQAHLMLSDDVAVESTLFGPSGVLAALSAGMLVVDHSTVSVAGTNDRARRIQSAGWGYLHAPVFAGPPQIAKGEGLMLIGGDAQTYSSAKAILSQIVTRHLVIGEKPEEAAAFKLMGNSMLLSIVEGLAEFFAIAKGAGIAPERAFRFFESFDPSGTISRRGPRMVAGDYTPPTFELTMAIKDAHLMIEASGDANMVPALKTIGLKMRRLIDQGYGKLDLAGLAVDVIPPRGGDGR